MRPEDDPQEVNRRFDEIIVGAGLADTAQQRPELRRFPHAEPSLYRVRVDLAEASPAIWRRLHLWSDLALTDLHEVIQIIFGWKGGHLYRFALGGDPFSVGSQVFLCPYEEEGEDESTVGSPAAATVRIDETLQEPGDELHYVYDFGDYWNMVIRLEEILPHDDGIGNVRVVAGERAAPPEDSGGIRDAEQLARVLPDPEAFDTERLNEAIARASRAAPTIEEFRRIPLRLFEMGMGLNERRQGEGHQRRINRLLGDNRELDQQEFEASSAAIRWFLDRAADDGIPLTAAGYMKPVDVLAASEVVPTVWHGYGQHNREANEPGIRRLRQAIQDVGLLRKYKGKLLLTRLGRAAQADPHRLREILVERLIPRDEGFLQDATLLFLLHAVSGAGMVDSAEVAHELTVLGYRAGGTSEVQRGHIHDCPVVSIIRNFVAGPEGRGLGILVSESASMLAREVLMGSGMGLPDDDPA